MPTVMSAVTMKPPQSETRFGADISDSGDAADEISGEIDRGEEPVRAAGELIVQQAEQRERERRAPAAFVFSGPAIGGPQARRAATAVARTAGRAAALAGSRSAQRARSPKRAARRGSGRAKNAFIAAASPAALGGRRRFLLAAAACGRRRRNAWALRAAFCAADAAWTRAGGALGAVGGGAMVSRPMAATDDDEPSGGVASSPARLPALDADEGNDADEIDRALRRRRARRATGRRRSRRATPTGMPRG